MSPTPAVTPSRRSVLTGLAGTAAGLALGAPPAAAARPGVVTATGRLAHHTGGPTANVYTFATSAQRVVNPGLGSFDRSGLGVSKANLLAVGLGDDSAAFYLGLFTPSGSVRRSLRIPRPLPFVTGTPCFSPDGARIAVSVNELDNRSGNRVDRTLILSTATGAVLAAATGWSQPVWVRGTGELVLAEEATRRLHAYASDLTYTGPLGITLPIVRAAAYDVSTDGRYVVREDGTSTRFVAHDRRTGTTWVPLRNTREVRWPSLSRDGRFLAHEAPGAFSVFPYVVPFARDVTVVHDAVAHEVPGPTAGVEGRMAWLS